MKKNNDWKSRLNIVYSTNPDFQYEGDDQETAVLPKDKQQIRISLDKKNRNGKSVTLITGFSETEDTVKELGKLLKAKCGVGGSVKGMEILVQGDFRERIQALLQEEGYKKTRII